MASVGFTPICEIRGDFSRKGDASEFSFKWKRRRQSFPCPRMVDSTLHCCLLAVPVAFSSLSYPECTKNQESNPRLPGGSPAQCGNYSTDLSRTSMSLVQKSTPVRSRPISSSAFFYCSGHQHMLRSACKSIKA